eukprot:TRINITY_DN6360_c0_g1_i1.p1 TRINITY_DN6360_c0_g1~~TRINITY_DN6360_c0_g1_i1.p1  ORF type:complete len:464 (+),score=54.35 TRINITY_DN6360_c0_g1_i1:48-1439(+)
MKLLGDPWSLYGWWLFFLLGAAPWLVVNGIFIEMPIFTKKLPEGDKLAAIIGAVVQIGNAAPFAYLPLRHRYGLRQDITVCVMLVVEVAVCLLLCFTWDEYIGGHSIPLLLTTFLGGVVGCTSKVTWFPFAGDYRKEAISAMSTGMGMSGLLGVLLGAAQGAANDNQNFDVSIFFLILLALSALGMLSFLLMLLPSFAAQWKITSMYSPVNNEEDDALNNDNCQDIQSPPSVISSVLSSACTEASIITGPVPVPGGVGETTVKGTKATFRQAVKVAKLELAAAFINSFLNYMVMPGMLPYLQEDKGKVFYATAFYYLANMIGRFVPTYIVLPNLFPLMGMLLGITVYLLYLAIQVNEDIPTTGGKPFIFGDVDVWWWSVGVPVFFFSLLNGYTATMVAKAVKLKEEKGDVLPDEREVVLQVIGLLNQIGSLIGTYISLALATGDVYRKIGNDSPGDSPGDQFF